MAEIKAFRAIRPTRDKVHLVATRPYYTYKKSVLKAKIKDNPFTFLHIISPEFGELVNRPENMEQRFELVRSAYQSFISDGILIQDKEPHVYVYRQSKDGQTYTGIIAAASVKEYRDKKIKRHEETLTKREEMFTTFLDIVGFNAEPVLLSYSESRGIISGILTEIVASRAEYEYMTTDLIKHELWVLDKKESEHLVSAFENIKDVYIADGHHRTASSAGIREMREQYGHTHFPNEDYFLAYFLEERQMNILEFNRLIRNVDIEYSEFLAELEEVFTITPLRKACKPQKHHEISMCLDGAWFRLNLKNTMVGNHPVESLDTALLTQLVLKPILGISDLKNDDRIDFVSGAVPLKKIQNKIKQGKYRIAFCLHPLTMEDIRRVADQELSMPPKSTWIEPKLRSGLTIFNLNE